jgi:hypothetical protein
MTNPSVPSYDPWGLFGSTPAGASVENPLVGNPAGGTAANNPLVANPAGSSAVPGSPQADPNALYTYNVAPGTQPGSGPFGSVPGEVGLPNPYQNLASVFPDLSQANASLSGNTLSELQGGVSPATLNALGQAQDQFGITGPINTSPESLGLTDEQLQNLGLNTFAGSIPTISTTQTVSPEVEAQIAQFNAQQAAQPNPTSSALASAGSSAIGAILSALL